MVLTNIVQEPTVHLMSSLQHYLKKSANPTLKIHDFSVKFLTTKLKVKNWTLPIVIAFIFADQLGSRALFSTAFYTKCCCNDLNWIDDTGNQIRKCLLYFRQKKIGVYVHFAYSSSCISQNMEVIFTFELGPPLLSVKNKWRWQMK